MQKLGADPEFVITDQKGNPVPAHLFAPHKEEPISACAGYHGKKCDCRGFFHRDGYNVEVNPAPSATFDGLWDNIRDCLEAVRVQLPAGYNILPLSSYQIDLATLKDAPPDVQQFGCEPAFDAYTNGEPKYVKIDGYVHPWRYCGWHMHISRRGSVVEDPSCHPMLVKLIDRHVGTWLTKKFSGPEQWGRRKFYGQAGEYRTQEYGKLIGLEYRTPPAEMNRKPQIIAEAYRKIEWVIDNFESLANSWDKSWESLIQRAINTGEGLEAFS